MKIKNIFTIIIGAITCGLILVFMRFYEAYYLEKMLYFQFKAVEMLLDTSFIDFKAILLYNILLIPFAIFLKNIKKLVIFYNTLLLFLNALLLKYFFINLSLLGKELFNFSFNETLYIINTEKGSLSFSDITLLFIAPIVLIVILSFIFKRIKTNSFFKKVIVFTYFVLIFFVSIDYKYYFPRLKKFNSYHHFILNYNKLDYFILDFSNKIQEEKEVFVGKDIVKNIDTYQKINNQFHYTSKSYPFLHNTPYRNVLGKYFQKQSTKPNIVIIMVESLSSSFSGNKAHLGSFTPFLDSLTKESLFWENFLSNADRTYGVLPNSLSSAPYFSGFVSELPYKKHNSLIKELNEQDYYTSFSYGGWANFNKMQEYLIYNQIDDILAENSFDSTIFDKHISTEKDFQWGYDDQDLFQQYLLHSEEFKQPYFSTILTISMHSPYEVNANFKLNDAKKYLGKLNTDQEKLFNVHPEKIKAIAFDDFQLKKFFEEYSKREDFDNTIFLIYGDHNIQSLPVKNEIDIFHTPFIIYSKLLTKPKSFKAISTQRDITPSLLGLLENNFGMSFKKEKHWLSNGLDTSSTFQSKIISPMVLGSSEFVNFIYNEHVVYHHEVFVIDSNLNLSFENDNKKKEAVLKFYNDYKIIEDYAYESDKLFK